MLTSTRSNPVRTFSRDILSSVLFNITAIAVDCIEKYGKNVADYIIEPYPFVISRVDGEVVEREILLSIQEELSSGTNTVRRQFGIITNNSKQVN